MRYYIDFGTGAGNEWVEGTLEDAKRVADESAAYTQQGIAIYEEGFDEFLEEDADDTCKYLAAVRHWYGLEYRPEDGEDEEDIIDFGRFGYYAPWSHREEW